MKKEKQSIGELQQIAATALNELQTVLRKENYKVITPTRMLSLAFRVDDDDSIGFKFLPADLTDSDFLKYQEIDPEDLDEGPIITKPSKPKFKNIHSSKSTPRMITRGVKAE